MTVSVTPKTITISNGTANDGSVVDTIHTDLYTNDATLASYINANCALTTGPNSFNSTQTFTATPVSTKGIDLARASEPTSPAIGEYWYSSTNNVFEGLVQVATITGATNASPIVVTTASAHGLGTGQTVYISGVVGNTAANGSFSATVTSSTTFSLDTSTGNGAYTSGGTVSTIQAIKQGLTVSAVSAISSNPTANVTDKGKLYVCTSTFTFGLTAAAILGASWYCYVRNDGTGIITIDPNASETIDGLTTINMYPGEGLIIVCDGSNFKTVGRRKGAILIQSQTASSSASVDFTTGFSDTEFVRYQLEWDGLVTATDNTNLWLRISQDGGSTWKSGASDYAYNFQFNNTGATLGNVGSTADTKIVVARNLDTTATGANSSGRLTCYNLQSTALLKNFRIESSTNADAASDEEGVGWGKFALNTNTAINGLRLLMASGNIASGTITLWGVRK